MNNCDIYTDINTNKENKDLFSSENDLSSIIYTNEKDIQNSKEGENDINIFNFNASKTKTENEEEISSKEIYFIQNKNNISLLKTTDTSLSSKNGKKDISQSLNLGKKRKFYTKELNDILIKKKHTASDDDNVLRKIQVNFISFIINFSNDVISYFVDDIDNKLQFQNIDYEIKKIVNVTFVKNLKSQPIKEILKYKISPKIKKKQEDENEKILDIISKEYPSVNEFFEKKYLDLFKEYYCNENNIFKVNGKIIPLSNKTKKKTYSFLIKKNHKLSEKIKYVCINYLLNDYKRIKRPNFKTILSN